ncbi:Kic1p [Rhizophagus irregularis DAOM 197198w]|uniref:Kic1p n=1 Tax=Rhizophagus irregularis (strain DAOM 197198w) TaxID=1432141 RepID=A0A015JVE9_RHIIW|nr:Kic1p [Rhizophagus irregularis DAOM 197198w]
MEELHISDEVYNQINEFLRPVLTDEQKLLINKVIPSELYESYIKYGLCERCRQIRTHYTWCQTCNSLIFKENFKNWTSGNANIDKFIQEAQLNAKEFWQVLEWIDYSQFSKVKYIAKGGFGTVYTAIWKEGYIGSWDNKLKKWNRDKQNCRVALKSLYNSQLLVQEFSKEVKFHSELNYLPNYIKCYGVSQDPNTKNYIMVMDYASRGSLRNFLNESFKDMSWKDKILYISWIIDGLKDIHDKDIIHRDFHSGNILIKDAHNFCIGDLGLCEIDDGKSVNEDKKIFGVLPYIAPEVLKGQKYTKAADIYAFGIIAYEIFTGLPPYCDIPHDQSLASGICKGLRPQSKDYHVPQLLLDLIEQCWNTDPLKRPSAKQLKDMNSRFFSDISVDRREKDPFSKQDPDESGISKQCAQANKLNKKVDQNNSKISYKTHPQAVYTSRLLNFKNLSDSHKFDIPESLYFDLDSFDEEEDHDDKLNILCNQQND